MLKLDAKEAGNRALDHQTVLKAVEIAFADAGERPLTLASLYASVSRSLGLDSSDLKRRVPIGPKGEMHSPIARTIRWTQQTLKEQGDISPDPEKRGVWHLTPTGKKRLHRAAPGTVLVAFSTRLGVALLADCRDALRGLGEPVHLSLFSPPYAGIARAYGRIDAEEYVDFLCESLEPLVASLADGASIVLNLGQDQFIPGSPARTLIPEEVAIALHRRLGLWKMDMHPWISNKAPGPIAWASKKRVHLNVAWEPVYVFSNNPQRWQADNRRVLEPHTERHMRFVANGGRKRIVESGDGAHRSSLNAYSKATAGRIPKNVRHIGNHCTSARRYRQRAKALALPVHGAVFPRALADFYIRYLTEPGQLMVDITAGSVTSGEAAEANGVRWVAIDLFAEYLRGGAERFRDMDCDLWINPELDRCLFNQPSVMQQGLFPEPSSGGGLVQLLQ